MAVVRKYVDAAALELVINKLCQLMDDKIAAASNSLTESVAQLKQDLIDTLNNTTDVNEDWENANA